MAIALSAPRATELKPRIVVFGIGGAGGNAVNNMIEAGLEGVEGRAITVERSFPDFDRFWAIALTGPRMSAQAAQLSPEMLETLRSDLKALLKAVDGQPLTLKATANAVKGRVPA